MLMLWACSCLTSDFVFTDVVEPVSNLRLVSRSSGFDLGFIMVSFSASTSPDITRYRVNCSDASCQEVLLYEDQTSIIISVSGSFRGSVNVVAINRCGRESQLVSETTSIPAIMVNDSCPVGNCTSNERAQGE